jgi:hypothetical protein
LSILSFVGHSTSEIALAHHVVAESVVQLGDIADVVGFIVHTVDLDGLPTAENGPEIAAGWPELFAVTAIMIPDPVGVRLGPTWFVVEP